VRKSEEELPKTWRLRAEELPEWCFALVPAGVDWIRAWEYNAAVMQSGAICYSCTVSHARPMDYTIGCRENRHARIDRMVWEGRIPDHWGRAAPLIESQRYAQPESVDYAHRGGQK
jgi:hypothetical protein